MKSRETMIAPVSIAAGWAAALDAAREAVIDPPIAVHHVGEYLINRDEALAAIDALREKS